MKSYTIIDAHCHIYPEKIAAKAVHGTDRFYELNQGSAFGGTTAELLNIKETTHISRFIVQSVATTPHQVASINAFIADEVQKSNGVFVGLGTLHPDSADISGDVEHLLGLGLRGVKLHPDIQRFAVDDPKCMQIYELCRGRLPILMHTGDKRYDFSNPDRVARVLRAFPDLTVIGAHLGGWSVWEEASRKLAGLDNLYVDTSSTIGFIGAERAECYIRRFDMNKILFGTDYPMWSPKDELSALLAMNFSEEEYEKLFHKNAEKLYGI